MQLIVNMGKPPLLVPRWPLFLTLYGLSMYLLRFPLPALRDFGFCPVVSEMASCQDCVSPCFYLSDPDKNINKWKFTAVLLGQTKPQESRIGGDEERNLPPDVT